jgi:Flp pilus assembly protein TadG
VEYALVTPLLLMLLAGALNYGLELRTATAVSAAAAAGAAYGSSSVANSTNTTGIQSAAVNSAPEVKSMTVASAQSCQCPGGAAVSCSGSCTGNMLMYVQVTVQATSSAAFSYSGLGFSGIATAQATMRVK